MLLALIALAGLGLAALANWRRALVLAIAAMFLGSTSIVSLRSVNTPILASGLLLLLLSALWTTRGQTASFSGPVHRLAIQLLWFVTFLGLLSTLWSMDQKETIINGATMLMMTGALHRVSTTRWTDRDVVDGDFSTVYWTLLAVLGIGASLAITGSPIATVQQWDGSAGRWTGVTANPNGLGAFAALALVLGVGVAYRRRSLLVLATTLLPLSQLWLSESRTSLLAALAGLVVVAVRKHVARTVVLVVPLLLAAAVFAAMPGGLLGSTRERFVRGGGDIDSLNGRTQLWRFVIGLSQDHPLGIGWRATPTVLRSATGLPSAHNSYLETVLELGWVAVSVVVLLVLLLAWAAMSSSLDGMGPGITAGVVAVGIIMLTESLLFGTSYLPLLSWLLIVGGSVLATGSSSQRRTERTRPVRLARG
ncbi:O-antigen ligase family protein [Actinomycetota bacterium]